MTPKEIRKIGNKELKLTWMDEHVSTYAFRYLRQNCMCALCVEEMTKKPLLAKDSVQQDLEGLKVHIVGSYALRFDFSDSHQTGIYTFEHLRKLCQCKECTKK